MGGITLPTASTPGYTSFPALYGPDVACDCLAAWLPVFSRLCVLKGYGLPVVWQLTGDNDASGGVHSQGGAVDFGGLGNDRAMLAREMGAWATWPRNWTGNQHTHAVLSYCPHNAPARYQLDAVRAGYDGLGADGRAGRDPLGPPKTYRSWSQGKAWAEAEIYRIEDAMFTDDDRSTLRSIEQALKGFRSEEAGRYQYYAGKFNEVLTEMAEDDATPVTIAPENVAVVADELARRVVESLPKA